MRRHVFTAVVAAAGLCAALLASCGDDSNDAGAAGTGNATSSSTVVVTTNILGDVTGNIVGDEATVEVLMPPNADPHGFGISAAEAARLTEADLVITNGLGLEEGIASNLDAAADAGVPAVEVAPQVDPLSFAAAAGDDAGAPDPHVWTDPDRMADASQIIAAAVIDHVDGVDSEALERNTSAYVNDLRALTDDMESHVATIPAGKRKLVTNHHVFGYFADRFGFEVVGAVLPSGTTLASPSAADLAELADTVRGAGVGAIFADSSQPDALATALADEVGLDVEVVALYSESLSGQGSGAATYIEMMRTNTSRIVDALRS